MNRDRRGRRDKRARHAGRREAELAGTFAVDVDVQRRIVQRLGVLQIAKIGNATPACARIFSAKARLAARLGPCTATSIGVGRAEAHHLADDVAGLERDLDVRQVVMQRAPDALA